MSSLLFLMSLYECCFVALDSIPLVYDLVPSVQSDQAFLEHFQDHERRRRQLLLRLGPNQPRSQVPCQQGLHRVHRRPRHTRSHSWPVNLFPITSYEVAPAWIELWYFRKKASSFSMSSSTIIEMIRLRAQQCFWWKTAVLPCKVDNFELCTKYYISFF